jgi:hypothetical protein
MHVHLIQFKGMGRRLQDTAVTLGAFGIAASDVMQAFNHDWNPAAEGGGIH